MALPVFSGSDLAGIYADGSGLSLVASSVIV